MGDTGAVNGWKELSGSFLMTRLGCMFASAFGGCCWTILQCGVQSLEVGHAVCSTGAFDSAGIVVLTLH